MTSPAIAEFLILLLAGSAGISLSLLLGVRSVVPLLLSTLAGATAIRVVSAFSAWSFGRTDLANELWWGFSLSVIAAATLLRWRDWKPAVIGLSSYAALAIAALSTKYLFQIGEREHNDSAAQITRAIAIIQREYPDLETLATSYKRGIAFTLMLGLGPEERILSGFTPLLFLLILTGAGWLAWKSLGADRIPGALIIAGASILLFSLTVPMFRAAMFYLNGHTLMGFAALLLLSSFLISREESRFGPTAASFALYGAVIGATARAEGIVIVGVLLAAIAGQRWWESWRERAALFGVVVAAGLALSWWFAAVQSDAFERLPIGPSLLVVGTFVAASLAAVPLIDPLRPWFIPAVASLFIVLLVQIIATSSDPIGMLLAQWPNLGLGKGGWATAAIVFVGSSILIGVKKRSSTYRWLLGLSLLIIATIFYTKTFDGGFGREGFYDSVNRMFLHVLPIILITALVGFTEVLRDAFPNKFRSGSTSKEINQSA